MEQVRFNPCYQTAAYAAARKVVTDIRNIFKLVSLSVVLCLLPSVQPGLAQCGDIVRYRLIDCGCDAGAWTETYTLGDAPSGYQDGSIECSYGEFPCWGGYVQSCPSGKLKTKPRHGFTNARNRTKQILVISGASNAQLSAFVPMCGEGAPKFATTSLLREKLSDLR